jgi:hypothetical protein
MQTAERVRTILSTKGLTLYQVSRRSAEMFGRSSLYFIPQRLYHELEIGAFRPNIHQLAALSRISNYRLSDWLIVFGFRLDDIPRLQLLIPWRRTVLLDSSIYDREQWVPWFADRLSAFVGPPIGPLGQFLRRSPARRARELLDLKNKRFLYVKVGRDDLFAFPTLSAGSIARIDAVRSPDLLATLGPGTSKSLFLVENGFSLNCGHLRRTNKNRVALCSAHFPFTQVELPPGDSARVLGLVDAEIRPFTAPKGPTTAKATYDEPKAIAAATVDPGGGLRQFVRMSRMRVGISFREASTLSRWIARLLGDQMYFAAPGTLSDYENVTSPLRHIQKIVSMCVLYCMDFWSFLRAAGISVDFLSGDPVSDEILQRARPYPTQPPEEAARLGHFSQHSVGFLSSLMEKWEELPLFLRTALPGIVGLKSLSLSDIFWLGGDHNPLHPSLVGGTLLSVNRRVKAPVRSTARTVWDQPLYVLLLRGGDYLCGPCELRRGVLIVHPHAEAPHNSIQLRNGIDAEVIGQVTAVLRRLP